MNAREDQFKGNQNKRHCLSVLIGYGLRVDHLEDWNGDFTWSHSEALIYLIREQRVNVEQAINMLQDTTHGEAYGVLKGLSLQEVKGLNLWKVDFYWEFKSKGMTTDYLRGQQKIDSFDNAHAFRYLINQKQYSVQQAMDEIDQLDCREACGVACGLTRKEVLGFNVMQINLLLDLKPRGLTADLLRQTHFKYSFGYHHKNAIKFLIESKSIEQALEDVKDATELQAAGIALGMKPIEAIK